MEINLKDIGERFIKARKHLGLSQQEMAKKADISRSFIGHVENGNQNPSYDFLSKIAETYEISIDWLLTGRGTMHLYSHDHYLTNLTQPQQQLLEKLQTQPVNKRTALEKVFTDILNIPE
ncbi:MAG: helix-turn-helix transcriptional regulator [bacterium]|nr:helix-turn-helix transcriptional regulator [bacterium]